MSSGTKRRIVGFFAEGRLLVDPKPLLAPAWRRFRPWRRKLPYEVRRLVDEELMMAIAVTMSSMG